MSEAQPVLVFVYLAESGLLNKLKDAVHKTFRPSTYPCTLCDITYSPVAMRRQWRRYVQSLPIDVEFSYTDLMAAAHPDVALEYPCAVLRQDGHLVPLISAAQINASRTIDDLIALTSDALQKQGLLTGRAPSAAS